MKREKGEQTNRRTKCEEYIIKDKFSNKEMKRFEDKPPVADVYKPIYACRPNHAVVTLPIWSRKEAKDPPPTLCQRRNQGARNAAKQAQVENAENHANAEERNNAQKR